MTRPKRGTGARLRAFTRHAGGDSFRRGSQSRQSIARAALRDEFARATSCPSELIPAKLRTALEPGSTKRGISQMQTEQARLSPLLRTGQNGLIRIEHNLADPRRSRQMKSGFPAVGEHTPNQHGPLTRDRSINRHGGHEIGWRILLKYGSAHRSAAILRQKLCCPQFQFGQRGSIHPACQKPVQRTLPLITQSWGKLFGEHVEQFARVDGLPLITLSYLSQRARERLIFSTPASAGSRGLQYRAVLHHGAQHVKKPGAGAITDGVIASRRTRRLQPAS